MGLSESPLQKFIEIDNANQLLCSLLRLVNDKIFCIFEFYIFFLVTPGGRSEKQFRY